LPSIDLDLVALLSASATGPTGPGATGIFPNAFRVGSSPIITCPGCGNSDPEVRYVYTPAGKLNLLINAEIPFDNILDRVTGSEPSVKDYILESPAKCPNCRREIGKDAR